MGIASIAGVVGVVGLGSTVESVEVVTIEILINILIVIVTIKGNVKVIAERLNGYAAFVGCWALIGAYLTTGQIIPGLV